MQRTYPNPTLLLAGALVVLGAAAPVRADVYLGGSIGSSLIEVREEIDFEDEVEDFDIDDDDFGWKAYAGVDVLPWLAVEGGFVDFGEVEEAGTDVTVRSNLDGWDAFAVGKIPLGIVDLFAKVGLISYDLDVDFDADDFDEGFSSSGEDLAYGAGVAVRLDNVGVRAEVERFDIDDVDELYLLSIGAELRF